MPQPQRSPFPPIPEEPVQEGARWRHHRPGSVAVAAWFGTQYIDEGMEHEHYVGGVVLIPQMEKVKYPRADGQGTVERHEQVFTPYVQIGTRLAYFRRLGEYRSLIPVLEPASVPRSTNPNSLYFNAHMDEGLWWHVVQGDSGPVRYLCATWTVALYEPTPYAAKLRGEKPLPVVSGRGTKQVGGGPDLNGIAKAQTGAVGRALGVAGILVVGTGIATAEDMMEYSGQAAPAPSEPQLPPSEIAPGEQPVPRSAEEELEALRARALALHVQMQEGPPEIAQDFAAWWAERSQESGWQGLGTVPFEALKGVVSRMERMLASQVGTAAGKPANAPTEVAP